MKKKAIVNLIRNKKWQSEFKSFKRTIMFFLLIPVIIFNIFISINYTGKIKNEINNKIDIAYMTITSEIDGNFRDINNIYNIFANDGTVNIFLTSKFYNFEGMQAVSEGERIKNIIRNAHLNIKSLYAVELYSMSNEYIISSVKSGYKDELKPSWYEYYKNNGLSNFVFSEDNYIVVCKGINIDSSLSGMLIFKLDKDEIRKEIEVDAYKTDIAIQLENMNEEEVFASGIIDDSSKVSRVYELKNESLKMNFILGDENRQYIIKTVFWYSITYLIAGIILAYILAMICTIYLYESVSKILSSTDSIKNKTGLIKNVNNNVFATIKQNDDIEQQLAKTLSNLYTAQLTALQMQINPHFVFNVLNYANAVILQITKCDNDASKIIVLLSEILQFAMDEPKYSTTVAKEIEIAKMYVEIEKIKTGKDFEVIWDIDENVLDCECIKLFLQPIIENSVIHGIKRLKNKKGLIKISVKHDERDIIFKITDNGPGMTPEKLSAVQKQLREPYINYSKHIGMRNVNERIKLVYGDGYGVDIISDSEKTEVTIRIGKR